MTMVGDVASLLRRARLDQGLSLTQLARKMRVMSKQKLSNWELLKNDPSIDDLEQWAESLGWRLVFKVVPAEDAELEQAVASFTRILSQGPAVQRRTLITYVRILEEELFEREERQA
jgi:transcriptional regulator with XRE-family HTH domain